MKFRLKVIDGDGKERKATIKATDENAALNIAKANGLFTLEIELAQDEPEVKSSPTTDTKPLKACRDCGAKVSPAAQSCPHCGAGSPARKTTADWVPCPKCGSTKTQKIGPGLLGFASFALGGCFLWIPIVGWILVPFFFLFAAALWVSALFPSGKISFKCQSCKQWFRIPKSKSNPNAKPKHKSFSLTIGPSLSSTDISNPVEAIGHRLIRIALLFVGVVAVLAAGIGVLLFFDTSPTEKKQQGKATAREEIGETIQYTILGEEVDESPGKTMVLVNILVQEKASEDELRALLISLYKKASMKIGFQYHTHPTVVGVYAYSSREHAESGNGRWLAMLTKNSTSAEPDIHVSLSANQEEDVEESRFGYSIDERKAIYKQYVKSEDLGMKKSKQQYADDSSVSELEKRWAYATQLTSQYKSKQAEDLKISLEDLKEIGREGTRNNWVMP